MFIHLQTMKAGITLALGLLLAVPETASAKGFIEGKSKVIGTSVDQSDVRDTGSQIWWSSALHTEIESRFLQFELMVTSVPPDGLEIVFRDDADRRLGSMVVTPAMAGKSLWSPVLTTDRARLNIEGAKAPGLFALTIARVAYETDTAKEIRPQSATFNWTRVSEPDVPPRNWSKSVAKLRFRDGTVCTGFLTGSDVFATAFHCFEDANAISNGQPICDQVTLIFDYLVVNTMTVQPTCVAVRRPLADKDFVVLKLKWGAGQPVRPFLEVAVTPAPVNSKVTLLHHPGGWYMVASDQCASEAKDGKLLYTCTTFGGSSGAPVLDGQGRVVALHTNGAYDEAMTFLDIVSQGIDPTTLRNFGIPASPIRSHLEK